MKSAFVVVQGICDGCIVCVVHIPRYMVVSLSMSMVMMREHAFSRENESISSGSFQTHDVYVDYGMYE